MTKDRIVASLIKFFDGIVLFLDKLLTMVVDRRLLFYVGTLAILFGLLPWSADQLNLANEMVADILILAGQLIGAIVGALRVISSWGEREPSGLLYGERRLQAVIDRAKENAA